MLNIKNVNLTTVQNIIKKQFMPYVSFAKAQEYLVGLPENNTLQTPMVAEQMQKAFSQLVYSKFLLDVEFVASKDASLTNIQDVLQSKTNGLVATMCYRIANFFYYAGVATDTAKMHIVCREFMEQCLRLTNIDIHPAAQIGEKFFIDHGNGIVIGETCEIGERCNLFNNVILGSKNVVKPKQGKRHPTLKNNVTICAGAKVLGDIVIGNNVFISPSAVVLDDIEDNKKILIINQLQIEKLDSYSYLPSQKLIVYGLVPKFKNGLNILGEGFYNPTVLIKLKNNKELNFAITYWDKNKIMIKFKNTTPYEKDVVKGVKLIILSNTSKVIVVNNLALQKALTNLCD